MTRSVVAAAVAAVVFCPPAAGGDVPLSRVVAEAVRRPPVQPTCGVDALYFVLQIHGQDPTLDELTRDIRLTDRGSSLADLRAAARARGLSYECVRCGPEELRRLPTPAIAHVAPLGGTDLAHYVVVLAVRQNAVAVFDPNDNRFSEVPLAEFNRRATGYYLADHRPLFPGWLAAGWAAAGGLLGLGWWAAARRPAPTRAAVQA
jgi:hypothetical protein